MRRERMGPLVGFGGVFLVFAWRAVRLVWYLLHAKFGEGYYSPTHCDYVREDVKEETMEQYTE